MLIVCPNCATSYQVEPSSLGATGRSVRCVRCKKVWFAANTEAMAAISLSHQQDLAALADDGGAAGRGRPDGRSQSAGAASSIATTAGPASCRSRANTTCRPRR